MVDCCLKGLTCDEFLAGHVEGGILILLFLFDAFLCYWMSNFPRQFVFLTYTRWNDHGKMVPWMTILLCTNRWFPGRVDLEIRPGCLFCRRKCFLHLNKFPSNSPIPDTSLGPDVRLKTQLEDASANGKH